MTSNYHFIRMMARMTTTAESKADGYEPTPDDVQEALDSLILTARKIIPAKD